MRLGEVSLLGCERLLGWKLPCAVLQGWLVGAPRRVWNGSVGRAVERRRLAVRCTHWRRWWSRRHCWSQRCQGQQELQQRRAWRERQRREWRRLGPCVGASVPRASNAAPRSTPTPAHAARRPPRHASPCDDGRKLAEKGREKKKLLLTICSTSAQKLSPFLARFQPFTRRSGSEHGGIACAGAAGAGVARAAR